MNPLHLLHVALDDQKGWRQDEHPTANIVSIREDEVNQWELTIYNALKICSLKQPLYFCQKQHVPSILVSQPIK